MCDLSGGGGTVGALDEAPVEVGREQLREVVHVLAQQCAAAKADPGRVRGEQVRGVDPREVRIVLSDRHVRDDAHTETEPRSEERRVGKECRYRWATHR